VNQNSAVNDFAITTRNAFAEMGKSDTVIRLHEYDAEVQDWFAEKKLTKRRPSPFEYEEATHACKDIPDEFMVQKSQVMTLRC
jgi:hypothetical protein